MSSPDPNLSATVAIRNLPEAVARLKSGSPELQLSLDLPSIHESNLTTTPIPYFRPHKLGNYEIRRELGRGGVGIVYEGFDPSLRRSAAIKILKNEDNLELLQRFHTEAEAVAQLQHPNIVQVYEVGTDNNVPFVALEYLSGGSLHQAIGGRPKPARFAADCVRNLAAAMAHAHKHGVLHRDLKPANVLFTEDQIPKITDFGAARFLEFNKGEHDPGLTRMGEIIGTPQYMAPEQASGLQDEIGPAVDVYSLGAILYELLTGRPPFNGVDPFDVIHSVRTQDPIPPRRHQTNIPRDLETICLKCLEKNPYRRYPSAEALQDDLRRFLEGETILAKPAGLVARTWTRIKRRPAVSGLIVGLIVASLVGLSAFIWQFQRTVAALDRAQSNEALATQLASDVTQQRQEIELQRNDSDRNLKRAEWNFYCSTIAQAKLLTQQGNSYLASQILEDAPKNLRNWEWYNQRLQANEFLWQFSISELDPTINTSWINNLSLCPNGSKCLVITVDPYEDDDHRDISLNPGNLAILNVVDGHPIKILKAILPTVFYGWWLNDKQIVIVGHYGDIKLIEAESGRVVAAWPVNHYQKGEKLKLCLTRWNTKSSTMIRLNETNTSIEFIDLTRQTPIRSVSFQGLTISPEILSPDGRLLHCFVHHNNQSRSIILNLTTGQMECEFPASEYLRGFSPDGKFAVSIGRNINPKKPTGYRHSSDQPFIPYSQGPGYTTTSTITIWNVETWTPHWTRYLPSETDGSVTFSPDNRHFVFVDHHLTLFNVDKNYDPIPVNGHAARILNVRFSHDGQFFLSASDDHTVKVWDVRNGHSVLQYHGHTHSVRQAMFSADGRKIISGGADELIHCIDVIRPQMQGGMMPQYHSHGAGEEFGAINFNRKGQLQVFNTRFGSLICDPNTGNPTEVRHFQNLQQRAAKEISDFSFNASGDRLAGRFIETTTDGYIPPDWGWCRWLENKIRSVKTLVNRHDIAIWNAETGQRLRTIRTGYSSVHGVTISPDGAMVVVSGSKRDGQNIRKSIRGWNCDTGKKLFEQEIDQFGSFIAFHPSGREFAVGMYSGRHVQGSQKLAESLCTPIKIFNCDGSLIDEIRLSLEMKIAMEPMHVVSVQYSTDGRKISFIDWGSASLIQCDRAEKTMDWNHSCNTPSISISYSPDNQRIAYTGYDDHIHIVDTVRGLEVTSFLGCLGRYDDFAFPAKILFSPDGRSLAATHWNGTFSIWHVDSMNDQPIDMAKVRARANATAFRFHLHNAKLAIESNNPFAYREHEKELNRMKKSTTKHLMDEWNEMKGRVDPVHTLMALTGGITAQ